MKVVIAFPRCFSGLMSSDFQILWAFSSLFKKLITIMGLGVWVAGCMISLPSQTFLKLISSLVKWGWYGLTVWL